MFNIDIFTEKRFYRFFYFGNGINCIFDIFPYDFAVYIRKIGIYPTVFNDYFSFTFVMNFVSQAENLLGVKIIKSDL